VIIEIGDLSERQQEREEMLLMLAKIWSDAKNNSTNIVRDSSKSPVHHVEPNLTQQGEKAKKTYSILLIATHPKYNENISTISE
jgi:hypothetical protein